MLLVPPVTLYCRVLIVKLRKNNVSAAQLNFKLRATSSRLFNFEIVNQEDE